MANMRGRQQGGVSAFTYIRIGVEIVIVGWAIYLYLLAQARLAIPQAKVQLIDGIANAVDSGVHKVSDLVGGLKEAHRLQQDEEDIMLRILSISGTQCNMQHHTDIWGDAVEWGGQHRTRTAAECCAACHAHRSTARQRGALEGGRNSTVCNVFVHCGDEALCGAQLGECWLKNAKTLPAPPTVPPGSRGAEVAWTSGVVYEVEDELPPAAGLGGVLTMHVHSGLHEGPIRVTLRPDLAPVSVRELRRMAAATSMAGGQPACTRADGGCGHIYRSEANFLLQGVIKAPGFYVGSPRHPNPQQQKVMERGLVCWAGGAGGPDFFINLIDDSGFGDSHLCWGKITDDMVFVDKIVASPLKPKAKPNDMTFLAEFVHFNLSLSES